MPKLTKGARERLLSNLLYVATTEPWPVGVHPNTSGCITDALAHIDALEARVAELEGKALAYDDLHAGDYLERAHALAQTAGVQAIGRNVWHVAVELAEQNKARVAELDARVAVLAAECRASRHNDECANYCTAGVGPRHDEDEWADASTTLKAARAATDAAGALS